MYLGLLCIHKKDINGCVILIVYFDDIVISSSDNDCIQLTKGWLKFRLHIKDLGQLRYFGSKA